MNNNDSDKIVKEYNFLRKNMNSRELLDSLMELPPAISFYIIPLKVADDRANLEKLKDYLFWYKYFSKIPIMDSDVLNLKNKYYDNLYSKYNTNDETKYNNFKTKCKELRKETRKICSKNI